MSTIETILTRMMNDPEFAEAVFTDAKKTLAEYSLTAEEVSKLNNLSQADFEKFAASTVPEERKSFATTVRGSGFYQIREEGG